MTKSGLDLVPFHVAPGCWDLSGRMTVLPTLAGDFGYSLASRADQALVVTGVDLPSLPATTEAEDQRDAISVPLQVSPDIAYRGILRRALQDAETVLKDPGNETIHGIILGGEAAPINTAAFDHSLAIIERDLAALKKLERVIPFLTGAAYLQNLTEFEDWTACLAELVLCIPRKFEVKACEVLVTRNHHTASGNATKQAKEDMEHVVALKGTVRNLAAQSLLEFTKQGLVGEVLAVHLFKTLAQRGANAQDQAEVDWAMACLSELGITTV